MGWKTSQLYRILIYLVFQRPLHTFCVIFWKIPNSSIVPFITYIILLFLNEFKKKKLHPLSARMQVVSLFFGMLCMC